MAKAKAVALVTQRNTALATPQEDWEIALAAKAKSEQAAEITGVPRITHRNGILKIDDKKVDGNVLRCVIVTYGFTKQYFKEAFDQENPSATPGCYAFAGAAPGAEAAMKPHEAAPDKQSAECTGCPHNVFGTAEKGRGKRCSDTRRLLLLVETSDPSSVVKAQVRQISVPTGSLKLWGAYQKAIKEVSPYGVRGVITEISTEEGSEHGSKAPYVLTFKATDRLEKDFIRAVVAKAEQVEPDLSTPFPVLGDGKEKPTPSKRSAKAKAKVE